jgi:hypothetical protein
MDPVIVYTVRSRRGVHLRTVRIQEAEAFARRFFYRRHTLPEILSATVKPRDWTEGHAHAA